MDSELPPAARELQARGIPYRLFRHTRPVRSLEEAAAERGQTPDQVIRSLLFRLSDSQFLLVLAAGPQQIPWKCLRQHLGTSRVTMASDEEVLTVTGSPPGAVSPFGLPAPVRILADSRIYLPAEVSLGSGERGTALLLAQPALRQALGTVESFQWEEPPAA